MSDEVGQTTKLINGEKPMEWIKVSDRKPKDFQVVLVWGGRPEQNYHIATWSEDSEAFLDEEAREHVDITHWAEIHPPGIAEVMGES